MTEEEFARKIIASSSSIKLLAGIGNNASWSVALEALDHARQCRGFRGKAKHEFNQAVRMFHEYENSLVYATKNRLFNLQDMKPEVRKKYGDITNREYYDFWAGIGATAYAKTRPYVTSLWNKYRLSLVRHDFAEAEHLAWVMTATAALNLAVQIYESSINDAHKLHGLQTEKLRKVFQTLSLAEVTKRWTSAMYLLEPNLKTCIVSKSEDRNIELGITQLMEQWMKTESIFGSVIDTVNDFDDIFRTEGEQKKALREIRIVKDETEKEQARCGHR